MISTFARNGGYRACPNACARCGSAHSMAAHQNQVLDRNVPNRMVLDRTKREERPPRFQRCCARFWSTDCSLQPTQNWQVQAQTFSTSTRFSLQKALCLAFVGGCNRKQTHIPIEVPNMLRGETIPGVTQVVFNIAGLLAPLQRDAYLLGAKAEPHSARAPVSVLLPSCLYGLKRRGLHLREAGPTTRGFQKNFSTRSGRPRHLLGKQL